MTDNLSVARTAVSPRRMLIPLQTAITLFLLVMAALMIPGSKW